MLGETNNRFPEMGDDGLPLTALSRELYTSPEWFQRDIELQQKGVNSNAYVPGPYHIPLEDDTRRYVGNYIALVKGLGPSRWGH